MFPVAAKTDPLGPPDHFSLGKSANFRFSERLKFANRRSFRLKNYEMLRRAVVFFLFFLLLLLLPARFIVELRDGGFSPGFSLSYFFLLCVVRTYVRMCLLILPMYD